jgi:hypothetical protein
MFVDFISHCHRNRTAQGRGCSEVSRHVTARPGLFITHATVLVLRVQRLKSQCFEITVFWDVAPCSVVEIALLFKGAERFDDGRKY